MLYNDYNYAVNKNKIRVITYSFKLNKMKKSNSKNKSTSKNEVLHSLTEEGLKHYKKTGKIPVRSTVKKIKTLI